MKGFNLKLILTMKTLSSEDLNESFLYTKEIYTFLKTQGGGFLLLKFSRNVTTKQYLMNYIESDKDFYKIRNQEIKSYQESKLKMKMTKV